MLLTKPLRHRVYNDVSWVTLYLFALKETEKCCPWQTGDILFFGVLESLQALTSYSKVGGMPKTL